MAKCKHCNKEVTLPHHCSVTNRTYREEDSGDFLLSAAIAAATDSAIIGGLVGGDIVGGIVGDMFDGDLFD